MRKRNLLALLLALAMITGCFPYSMAFAEEEEISEDFFNKQGTEYDNIDFDNLTEDEITFLSERGMAAYTDVEEAGLTEETGLLGTLGIMEGYEDFTFRPEEQMTRGEFAKSMLALINVEPEPYPLEPGGMFYDVPKDNEWYAVVSTAVTLGIVKGNPDNTFRPGSAITSQEAVVMTLRALGYEQMSQIKGGYPMGYLETAHESDILNSLPFNDQPITRGQAAQLIYNAAHAAVLSVLSIRYDGDATVGRFSSSDDATALYVFHDIRQDTGVVNATHITAQEGYISADEKITIGTSSYAADNNEFDEFFGYQVEYYYQVEEEKVVYMTKDDRIKEEVILSKDIIGFDAASSTLTYYSNNRTRSARVDKNALMIYNGMRYTDNYSAEFYNIEDGMIKLLSNTGSGAYDTVFIESYQNVLLNQVSASSGMVTFTFGSDLPCVEINANETIVDFYSSANARIPIYKRVEGGAADEKMVDVSDVPSEVVASIYVANNKYDTVNGHKVPAVDAEYIKVRISGYTLSGSITTINDKEQTMKIDDRTVDIAASNYLFDLDTKFEVGDSGILRLDSYGKAVAFEQGEAEDGAFNYGYLITAAEQGNFDKTLAIKLMDYNGDILQCVTTTKLRINGKKAGDKAFAMLSQSAGMLRPERTVTEGDQIITYPAFTISQVIKYKLQVERDADGNVIEPEKCAVRTITELETVTAPVGVAEGYDANHLSRYDEPREYYVAYDSFSRLQPVVPSGQTAYYGTYFKPGTYFVVPTTETFDEDDYSVRSYNQVSAKTMEPYDVKYMTPTVMLIYEDNSSTEDRVEATYSDHKMPVMVSEVGQAVYDEQIMAKITVCGGADMKEYYSEDLNMFDGLEPGDMVFLLTKGDDLITKVIPLTFNDEVIDADMVLNYDLNRVQKDSQGTSDVNADNYYSVFGEAYDKNGDDFIIQNGPILTDSLTVADFPDGLAEVDIPRLETTLEQRKQTADGLERLNQYTARMAQWQWMFGGVIVYDSSSSREPSVRVGTIADIKTAREYGDTASRIFFFANEGAARQYVIYNFSAEEVQAAKAN